MKELACDVLECLEEAYSESQESDGRESARYDGRYNRNMRNDDYDDYERDEARGRGGRGRGRY